MSGSLVFDDTIELHDPDGHVSDQDFWFEGIAEGSSWGDPQPIEVTLNSLMRDGAIVSMTGDGNREATFPIRVMATDSASLDAGVQALQAATRKRTTLVWTPEDGYCEPRVWDVETSNLLQPGGISDLEYVRNQQVFTLRLVCQPYRRSAVEVVDDAGTPPSSGGTLLYNCESTTGWADWYSGGLTPVVDSVIFTEGAGSLRTQSHYPLITTGSSYSYFYWRSYSTDQVTGLSLDTDTGGYLSIAIRIEYADVIPGVAESSGLNELFVQIGGSWVEVLNFVATRVDGSGFVHYVWPVDAGLTITGLKMAVRQLKLDNSGNGSDGFADDPYVWYDDVELLPSATTDHQIVKQHFVQGSARTAGTLRISSPSESVALGKVLTITVPTAALPAGFQPDGERWVTQGTTTTDATALAGHYYTPDASAYLSSTGKPIFEPPVTMLAAGAYTMVALVKVESLPLVAGVQAQLVIGGTAVGPTSTAEVSIPDIATGWALVPLGEVDLPPTPMQGADSTAKVRLLFKGAKMANVYFIPAWEVNGWPVADFSIVDCGTGTVGPAAASSSLFLDAPSVMQSRGDYWRGPSPDRLNARSARDPSTLKKPGTHFFLPGAMTNFVVSLGAAGPTSTLRYPPRYL